MLNRMLFKSLVIRPPMSFASFHSSYNLTFYVRNSRLKHVAISLRTLLKPKAVQNTLVRKSETNAFSVNTKVQNNVLLYKNENDSQYRMIMFFGIAQLVGWGSVGYISYTPNIINGWYEAPNAKEYFRQYALSLVLCITSVIAGPAVFLGGWLLTIRSIKYMILNKGGKHITIVTHHPLTKKPTLTIPVEQVRTSVLRTDKKQYTPLKILGKPFYFMLEGKGEYVNPRLYSSVVEVSREW